MALDPAQKFIKKNFRIHVLAAASIIAQEPLFKKKISSGDVGAADALYCFTMSILERAFKEGKIIIKNSPAWDDLEGDSDSIVGTRL